MNGLASFHVGDRVTPSESYKMRAPESRWRGVGIVIAITMDWVAVHFPDLPYPDHQWDWTNLLRVCCNCNKPVSAHLVNGRCLFSPTSWRPQ